MLERINELVEQLNNASEAYYDGLPIMTDREFDDLFDELKRLEAETGKILPDSPTQNVGAAPVAELPSFAHTYPALSLDKTKDASEMIKKFKAGIANSGSDNDDVVLMWKEDGSTVQAYYKAGKLQHLVTRGNGHIGSDITHNAKVISGIPLAIPVGGEVVVRGEALMSYTDFNKINDALPLDMQYKNPRNLAAASIQMLNPEEVKARHITIKAFNLVHADENIITFSNRLEMLYQWGFDVVEYEKCSVDKLQESIDHMSSIVSSYPYPVDGLVAAMDNYRYAQTLAGTEHHPHIMQGYAFKWSDEAKETVLREIEWSPSRTGLLNPVAVFDPVELEGTTVQRASLHNLSIMRQMRIHVGDKLEVLKANKIIPYVNKNLSFDDEVDYTNEFVNKLISCCPRCGTQSIVNVSEAGIETVCCPNEDCPEKLIGKLAHFCERDCLDIKGMSEETIKKLVDGGFIKEYLDFFALDQKLAIAFLPGFGKQSWKKLCEAAEKSRKTDFVSFLTALSIPNIGRGQAKTLYRYVSQNYEQLCTTADLDSTDFKPMELLSYLACAHYDFSQIDGFGDIMSQELANWLLEHFRLSRSTPETRVYGALEFTDKRVSTESTNGSIAGKSFCITGKLQTFKNRQELVAKIESLGGTYIDSVSSKTSYLINNDVSSTSGKNAKAKQLNIPIISEESFLKMCEEDNE